jgi:DNA-binding NtrC family response regulator
MTESVRLFKDALSLATSLERPGTVLRAQLGLGWVALRGGELGAARARLLAAWREARRRSLRREEALALDYLCQLYILFGANRLAIHALSLCDRLATPMAPDGDIALEVKICRAMVSLAIGEPKSAIESAREAIRCARSTGMRWEEARALRILAIAHLQTSRKREARESLRKAQRLLADIGEILERGVVEAWLQAIDQRTGQRRRQRRSPGAIRAARTGPAGSDASAGIEGGGTPVSPAASFWLDHPLLGPQGWLQGRLAIGDPAGPRMAPRRAAAPTDAARVSRGDSDPAPTGADDRPEPSGLTAPEVRRPQLPAGASHPIWAQVGMVTRTPDVHRILRLAETYAPSMIPVLILGETGTGKDLIAQGIHALSGHAGNLVPVNCAAARKELFVAELFGARRGAYTGATEHRRGLIEEAEGGTIFFDEVADLEPEAQGFLLRFLDTGEVRPLGETRSRHVQTRVVAATCRDMGELVRDGRFRPDLYGRLAGLRLRVPALRERAQDLELLIAMLWQRQGGSAADYPGIFTPAVLAALGRQRWPGNVRELKHAVDRAMLFSRSHGSARASADLLHWIDSGAGHPAGVGPQPDSDAPAPGMTGPADRAVRDEDLLWGEWDPAVLQDALQAAGGNIPKAARILGLSRSHAYRLYKKLKEARRQRISRTEESA